MAQRVAGDGWVEIVRTARCKDVGNKRYGWVKRIQSSDVVVPGFGEDTGTDSVHLVEGVAILRSRILEQVVKGIEFASAARWLWRRGWDNVRGNSGWVVVSEEARILRVGGERFRYHVDSTGTGRSRRIPGVAVLIRQVLVCSLHRTGQACKYRHAPAEPVVEPGLGDREQRRSREATPRENIGCEQDRILRKPEHRVVVEVTRAGEAVGVNKVTVPGAGGAAGLRDRDAEDLHRVAAFLEGVSSYDPALIFFIVLNPRIKHRLRAIAEKTVQRVGLQHHAAPAANLVYVIAHRDKLALADGAGNVRRNPAATGAIALRRASELYGDRRQR